MKKAVIILTLVVGVGVWVWLGRFETTSMDGTIEARLDLELGREAGFQETRRSTDGQFSYICGKPIELNGDPFDYTTTLLKDWFAEGTTDDSFCALLKDGELVEFDLGSTDMPVFDWLEKYNLDETVILE